jgi:predicted ATPase
MTVTPDLHDKLFNSIMERERIDPTLSSLSKEERAWWTANLLEYDISQNGFSGYLTNSSSDHYYESIEGLRLIGAVEEREIVLSFVAVAFGDDGPPANQNERWERMTWIDSYAPAETIARLDELEEQFRKVEDIFTLREKYAEAHGLLKLFQQDN